MWVGKTRRNKTVSFSDDVVEIEHQPPGCCLHWTLVERFLPNRISIAPLARSCEVAALNFIIELCLWTRNDLLRMLNKIGWGATLIGH